MDLGVLFGGYSIWRSSRFNNLSRNDTFKLALRSTGTGRMIGASCFGLIRASWESWKGDIGQKESAWKLLGDENKMGSLACAAAGITATYCFGVKKGLGCRQMFGAMVLGNVVGGAAYNDWNWKEDPM
jgi:hypothetical protein